MRADTRWTGAKLIAAWPRSRITKRADPDPPRGDRDRGRRRAPRAGVPSRPATSSRSGSGRRDVAGGTRRVGVRRGHHDPGSGAAVGRVSQPREQHEAGERDGARSPATSRAGVARGLGHRWGRQQQRPRHVRGDAAGVVPAQAARRAIRGPSAPARPSRWPRSAAPGCSGWTTASDRSKRASGPISSSWRMRPAAADTALRPGVAPRLHDARRRRARRPSCNGKVLMRDSGSCGRCEVRGRCWPRRDGRPPIRRGPSGWQEIVSPRRLQDGAGSVRRSPDRSRRRSGPRW